MCRWWFRLGLIRLIGGADFALVLQVCATYSSILVDTSRGVQQGFRAACCSPAERRSLARERSCPRSRSPSLLRASPAAKESNQRKGWSTAPTKHDAAPPGFPKSREPKREARETRLRLRQPALLYPLWLPPFWHRRKRNCVRCYHILSRGIRLGFDLTSTPTARSSANAEPHASAARMRRFRFLVLLLLQVCKQPRPRRIPA